MWGRLFHEFLGAVKGFFLLIKAFFLLMKKDLLQKCHFEEGSTKFLATSWGVLTIVALFRGVGYMSDSEILGVAGFWGLQPRD